MADKFKLVKEVGEHIRTNILGCKFVGLGDDCEAFISFEHNDDTLARAAIDNIKKEFPDVPKITIVEHVSISDLTKLVDALNSIVEEDAPRPKGPLLDIGEF